MPALALPGEMVDLIRDGCRFRPEGGQRPAHAIYGALVSTAMSAQRRGWTFSRWHELVTEPRSALGVQAGMRFGHSGSSRPRSRSDKEKTLRAAWSAATSNLQPDSSADFTRRSVEHRVAAVRALLTAEKPLHANGRPLGDVDRRVLEYAAREATSRGFLVLALPWRKVCAETGAGERAVKNALNRLDASAYLKLRALGRADAEPGRRKASRYELMPALAGERPAEVPPPRGNTTMGPLDGPEPFLGPPPTDVEERSRSMAFMGPQAVVADRFATLLEGLAVEEVDDLAAMLEAFASSRQSDRHRVAS